MAVEESVLAGLRQGDFVKIVVNAERLWFQILAVCPYRAFLCRLDNDPTEKMTKFDGRVTINWDWIVDTMKDKKRTDLKLVKP